MGRKYICPASICCVRGKHIHATAARFNAKVSSNKLSVYSLAQLLLNCFSISSIITPKRNRYIIQRNQGVVVGITGRNYDTAGSCLCAA